MNFFKKQTIKVLILLLGTIAIIGYFFISSIIGKGYNVTNGTFNNLKSVFNAEQKQLIKKF